MRPGNRCARGVSAVKLRGQAIVFQIGVGVKKRPPLGTAAFEVRESVHYGLRPMPS